MATARAIKDEANGHFQRKEWKQAARKYRMIFGYVRGLVGAGDQMAQYKLDKSTLATGDVKREARELEVTCYKNLSAVYFQQGEFAKALDEADKAVKLSPDDAKAHVRRAQALTELGRVGDAREAYVRAAKLEPDNKAVLGMIQKFQPTFDAWSAEQDKKARAAFAGKLL